MKLLHTSSQILVPNAVKAFHTHHRNPARDHGFPIFWKQLALVLKSCICIPELRLQNETSRCRRAARILDYASILARIEKWFIDASGEIREYVRRLGSCSLHCRRNSQESKQRGRHARARSPGLHDDVVRHLDDYLCISIFFSATVRSIGPLSMCPYERGR